ncbi:MAG TPA: hypothetical protein VGA81_05040 [Methylomirabilota bacterium]
MSGAIDRAARRVLRLRVLSLFLLCVLTFWFAVMTGTYRTPSRLSALTILLGVIVLTFDALLLARRVSNATLSETSSHLLDVGSRFAPLVVLNLMVLNVLAPVIGHVAALMSNISVFKTGLTLLGWLSAQALFGLFVLGIAGVLAVTGMRLLDRAVLRWRPVERAVTLGDRAIVGLTALYCAWAMLLTFNGSLDRGESVAQHRSEILSVWGVPNTPLWWADVRSWDEPGGLKRVLIFPERDQVVPTLLSAGQRVRVRIRSGFFGLPWVESMRLDFEHELEPLVAAAPSAAAPRKQLIELLLRDGRWPEAATQTAIYTRYHPGDRVLVERVAGALRAAGQVESAIAVSQTRGTR